jgi:hypothetical protein
MIYEKVAMLPQHTNVPLSQRRVCVLVLGMHRSGTSAVTRVLSLLGCDLPKTLMAAKPNDNEPGFWESTRVAEVNEKVLASAGSHWHDWTPFNSDWFSSPKSGEFRLEIRRTLEAEYGNSHLFVVKDPRICRFAPLWLGALDDMGVLPRIVLPIRHPLEVAASLARRNNFDTTVGCLIWLRHVLDAEHMTRGRERSITLYDQLLSSWSQVASKAGDAFGFSWPRFSPKTRDDVASFLAVKHRHHHEGAETFIADPLQPAWHREVFDIFMRWAKSGECAEDYQALDSIRSEFDAATPAFARLVSEGCLAKQKARDLGRALAEARTRVFETEKTSAVHIDKSKKVEADLQTLRDTAYVNADAIQRLEKELSWERAKLAKTEDWIFRLAAERTKHESEVRSLEGRLTESGKQIDRLIGREEELCEALAHAKLAEENLAERAPEAEALRRQLLESNHESGILRTQLAAHCSQLAALAAQHDLVVRKARTSELALETATTRLKDAQDAFGAAESRRSEAEARVGTTLDQAKVERREVEYRLAERFTEIAEITKLLRSKDDALRAKDDALRAKDAELVCIQQQIARRDTELAVASRERKEVEGRLANEVGSRAALSHALKEREALVQRMHAQTEWIRETLSILLSGSGLTLKNKLFGLLPAAWRRAKQLKELKRQGLFDADQYLSIHPDVSRSGEDPLRHYVNHGIREGRSLTMASADR